MFVLRTGLQGHGKTLNTIKEVDQKAANEGRAVYYHNIRGFNPTAEVLKAVWQEFDDPHKWHELPENAIIVIDEAQTFFRVRKQAAAVPEYASALETMRHRGHELHCITQSPCLIDHHFRKLCNSHIHYVRGHKGKVSKRWEFERVNPDVERKSHFQEGEASRVLLDKKYFDVYQSVAKGSEHHMRFKPPKALWLFIGCIVFFLVVGYSFYQRRFAEPLEAMEAQQKAQNSANPAPADVHGTANFSEGGFFSSGGNSRKREPLTLEEYLNLRTPRLPDVPSSAPLYDEVTKAVTYPKLSCMATWDVEAIAKRRKKLKVGIRDGALFGCLCNTQQGTRAMVSADACLNYVENGAFDPAKPDAVAEHFAVGSKANISQGREASKLTKAPDAASGKALHEPKQTPVVSRASTKGSFGMLTSDPLGIP